MVKGLKALHDLKILHRDLKSANIFLFSDGSAKIGDLNVSKVAKKGIGYTQTGTPYYASPEVWRDEPYDSKSDIWSLACVTYEMLELHPPFKAENMKGLYEKVIKGKYPKINDRYSSDISDLLKILFSINPKERPSCDEILHNKIVIKRLDFLKSGGETNDNPDIINVDENTLLRTIRLPKKLIFLSNKLPKANYDTITDQNISTAENTKEITNNYSIHKLPSIKKLNDRYNNLNMEENKRNKESKLNNLNIITEALNQNNNIINNDNSNSRNGPTIPPRRNISLSPSLKLPIGDDRLNNISNQRLKRAVLQYSNKNEKYKKGSNGLYISNDYKIPSLRNGNNIGLYLPNIFVRKNSEKRYNNISQVFSNVNSKRRLNPLNIKNNI
jgi:NIMA (never in mitosis gene a)-related kinase